jgi:subtilisin family serine protease
MEAMIRAYQDGADIISMSLGGPNGWSQTPEAILATRLIELGVVMSLANGNDGLEGLCTPPARGAACSYSSIQTLTSLRFLFQSLFRSPRPQSDR